MAQSWLIRNGQKELAKRRKLAGIDAPLSNDIEPVPAPIIPLQDAPDQAPERETLPTRVKIYPSLALAFLEHFPSVGRVYDLLKAYDLATYSGRGFIHRDEARELLTVGPWRCMSWRRLRQILQQGGGITWSEHHNGNIQLFSPGRVAVAMGAGILRGRPVWVDPRHLNSGIQQVRATYYATFDAGQSKGNPITRQAKRQATGIPESTQRVYDAVAGTKRKANIAVSSESYNRENRESRAWENGRNTFKFYDHRGQHVPKGHVTIAWRLPNSYTSQFELAPKGRQRKHNKRINLVIKREQGTKSSFMQLYHPAAGQAVKAIEANPGHDHYYSVGGCLLPSIDTPPKLAPASTWGVIAHAK